MPVNEIFSTFIIAFLLLLTGLIALQSIKNSYIKKQNPTEQSKH